MKKDFKLHLKKGINDDQLFQPRFQQLVFGKSQDSIETIKHKSEQMAKLQQSNKISKKSPKKQIVQQESQQQTAHQFIQVQNFKLQSEKKQNQNLKKVVQILKTTLKKNNQNGNKIVPRKKEKIKLREIIGKQKVKNLCNRFVDKIKRNNIYSKPVDFLGFRTFPKQNVLQREGFEINKHLDNLLSFFSILQIVTLFISYTLALVFSQVSKYSFISNVQTLSISFYMLQIIYNSVTVKISRGKKLQSYGDILKYYSKTNMAVDIMNLLTLFIDNYQQIEVMLYLRLFIIAKLPQCLEKLEKLQLYFIKCYQHEQYLSLVKILIFNFGFAHILAILLTAMADTVEEKTWHTVLGINNAAWFEQYIWAYYWGCNIMLTVGFGDIAACNYKEALCLIFIEIISVICLAYNINSVGTLISNIRSQETKKFKHLKTLKQLSDKYELHEELEWKISNHIQESVNKKTNFNIEEQKFFLENLPTDLKKQYLKETNRSIFDNMTFFKTLMEKTLISLAENIEISICHPEQVIRKIKDNFNLYILRSGEVGLASRRKGCDFNGMVMDSKKVRENEKPFLLGLQFLTRKKNNFEIKSKEYSVVYVLGFEKLMQTLKESEMDYHHFCYLRDKNETNTNEYEVFDCEFCQNKKHTKFACPKLHFIPLTEHVIHKQQFSYKNGRKLRNQQPSKRIRTMKIDSLINFKVINNKQKFQNLSSLSDNYKTVQNSFLSKFHLLNNDKNLYDSNNHNLSYDKLTENIFKNASQLIKEEFLLLKKVQNYEDQIWMINCDRLKNYQHYFSQGNPCNLGQTSIKNKSPDINSSKSAKQIEQQTILKQFMPETTFISKRTLLPQSIKCLHTQGLSSKEKMSQRNFH